MGTYDYKKEIFEEKSFNFIYGCALRDAVLQKSFVGNKTWINNATEAIAPVKTYIDLVLKGKLKTIEDHDQAFLDAAKDVCDAINEYKPRPAGAGIFHFGNAQKLLNMTVKHVYTHMYSIHTAKYGSIRENFRFCHCPLDQEMMSNVWKDYGNTIGTKERKEALPKFDEFHKAWGNEDFGSGSDPEAEDNRILPSRYMSFQKAVRAIIEKQNGDVFPIEYDFIKWKV